MNNSSKLYESYFANHYGYSFVEDNLTTYYRWFKPQWELIKKFINLSKFKQQRVLEVGSSIGTFSQFLVEAGVKKVTGLELDNDAVLFAQKHFPQFNYKNISLEKFKSNLPYDFVFSFEVLEHVDSPKVAINQIYKLLRSGGTFIGSSPFPYPKNIFADETHQNVLHPQNWKKVFKDAGFTRVSTYPMSFAPFLWRYTSLFHWRLPFYIPWKFWISTTLIVAEK